MPTRLDPNLGVLGASVAVGFVGEIAVHYPPRHGAEVAEGLEGRAKGHDGDVV